MKKSKEKCTRKYKVKITPNQLKAMRLAWKSPRMCEDIYYQWISMIENSLRVVTGIRDIEFFKDTMFGGEWIGIGNVGKTMKLYQAEQLEKEVKK